MAHVNLKGILGTLIAAQVGKAITRGGAGAAGGAGGIAGTLSRTLGGSAGTALAGALASMILGSKKGRAVGGSLGKLGGLAVIGSLAWNAYQDWQAKQAQAAPQPGGQAQPAPRPASFGDVAEPPRGSPLAPEGEEAEEELSRVFIRAMIAAAKADGHIDAAERQAIGGELQKLPLGDADRVFVEQEVAAPLDVERVARGAAGNTQLGTAIYAASLLAITVDTDAERAYLAELARKLALAPDLVRSLHAKVEEAAPVA